MKQITKIYDNEGKTLDRYTILTEPFFITGKSCECLGLSNNPTHPTHGFSQWGDCFAGEHLGKEIEFDNLPDDVQEHIIERLEKTN